MQHSKKRIKLTFRIYRRLFRKGKCLVEIPNWAMLFDRGYVGPAEDTPGLRKMTPKKGTLTLAETQQNAELGRLRVPVEQFFGRMQQLWRITRVIYRWGQEHFDLDIGNCILLTNECLRL